jgi:hypothetical protein
MALWASTTLKTIKSAETPYKIAEPSLREKLMNLQMEVKGYELSAEVRKEFLKLFTDGVELENYRFSQ